MGLPILAGSANVALAEAVAARLDIRPGSCEVQVFPDGELYVEIQESVRGEDVYLIQPTSSPAEKHLLEVLLLADAAHRAGAVRLTAVIPYFGYARQDRRVSGREAVGPGSSPTCSRAVGYSSAWSPWTYIRTPSRGFSVSR
jgi:ribose-phosphate pyrophosphokinase